MMQQALDDAGLFTHIMRVGPKWYQFHLNGEVIRRYRQRNSCNVQIKKLYKKLKQQQS